MTFSPDGIIRETYPDPVPNLYQGIQMLVSGRYTESVPVQVLLTGTAFGRPVSYEYDMALADSVVAEYAFLTKLWAKRKIEHLLFDYHALDPESPEAEVLREEIISLSLDYGVISPFTHFQGSDDDEEEDDTPIDGEGGRDEEEMPLQVGRPYALLGNSPNPFNPVTTIRFVVGTDIDRIVLVRIYDIEGRLVRVLAVHVGKPDVYSIRWDGTARDGTRLTSGVYFYSVDFGDAILVGKMLMVK
jgi:hypothetical protein